MRSDDEEEEIEPEGTEPEITTPTPVVEEKLTPELGLTEDESKLMEKEREAEEEPEECECPHCHNMVTPIKTINKRGTTSYRCSECGKFFRPTPPREKATKPGEEAEKEEEKPLQPLEVEMTERVKELLPQYLSKIYGIPKGSKRIEAIIDTLTPEQTADPMNLHAHIKNFAPDANDRHLEAVILRIYSILENEGYIPPALATQYTPRYARRGSRTGYARYPGRYPSQEEWYEDEEYEGYPRRGRPVKVVVDGQTIETDVEGMMAVRRFKMEEEEGKRAAREHELRMKKLDEEIKAIAKGGTEDKVPVKLGDQTISVPASVAPFILKGGDSDEVKSLRQEVQNLEKKLGEKERQELRDQLTGLYGKIDELENKDPLEQIRKFDDYAEERGFHRGGKTTIDLIDTALQKGDQRAQQLISRLGPKGEEGETGQEFKPEVSRTPEERQAAAAEIEEQLHKKEKILEAENRFLQA